MTKIIRKHYKCPECDALNETIKEEGGPDIIPTCNRPGMCSRTAEEMELITASEYTNAIDEIEARVEEMVVD